MAKKPNYGFEKRRKELERQKKKDEKLQARRERAGENVSEAPPAAESDTGDSQ